MALRINTENFDKEVLQNDKAVLVEFYSDSCISCKMLNPVLSQIESENSDLLKVVKVNVNFDIDLAERFEVQAAPTLVYFENGAEKARLRGAKKKKKIEDLLSL